MAGLFELITNSAQAEARARAELGNNSYFDLHRINLVFVCKKSSFQNLKSTLIGFVNASVMCIFNNQCHMESYSSLLLLLRN